MLLCAVCSIDLLTSTRSWEGCENPKAKAKHKLRPTKKKTGVACFPWASPSKGDPISSPGRASPKDASKTEMTSSPATLLSLLEGAGVKSPGVKSPGGVRNTGVKPPGGHCCEQQAWEDIPWEKGEPEPTLTSMSVSNFSRFWGPGPFAEYFCRSWGPAPFYVCSFLGPDYFAE